MVKVAQQPLKKDIVRELVLKLIADLKLQPGDRLQSEKHLAAEFGVNHQTVRAAFADLAERGIVERCPGSGTFIKNSTVIDRDDNEFYYDSGKTVVVAMRDDPHFFSGLRNELVLELEEHGMLAIAVGNSGLFSKQNVEQLLRFNRLGAKQLVIDQTFVLQDSETSRLLRCNAAKFDNIVMVHGNHLCDAGLGGQMVFGDYQQAYGQAIDHLKALGHYKIGFMGGSTLEDNSDWQVNRRNVELYTQAMLNCGLAESIKFAGGYSKDNIEKKFKDFLAQGYTALFCDCDYRAAVVLDIARDHGVSVPDELSVIGFFDTPWAEHYNMTSFRYRNQAIAEKVVNSIIEPNSDNQLSLVKIDFIERGTTGQVKEKFC
jgi:DNA-binding LacI/PurR family transcriptional regulator